MQEHMLNLLSINESFRALAKAHGWEAYHTPKNLAAAISVESAELLEIFQWLTDAESESLKNSTERSKVADEVADIVMYVVELCVRLDINLPQAITEKIEKNHRKE